MTTFSNIIEGYILRRLFVNISENVKRPKSPFESLQVIKPKPLRHPESDSDDDDDDLTPAEREARGIRGLTREQVIRMAKKSDASKRKLREYESPTSSRDDLGRPVYLLNQKELDEELMHFRTFFAQTKEEEPSASDGPPTSTPKGKPTPSTSFESTSHFSKKETTTSVSKKVGGDTTYSYQSHSREQSSSDTVSFRTLSPEGQSSVTRTEERKDEKSVETSEVKATRSPASIASRAETAIDVSAEELDRLAEEEGGNSSRPTAVVRSSNSEFIHYLLCREHISLLHLLIWTKIE